MGVPMKMQYTVDLHAPLKMQEAGTLMVEGDNQAHAIILEVVDGESPAVLDGCTATAYMIRADGNKPFAACTIEGNIIQAALTASFYTVSGRYHLFVRLTNTKDNTRRTLLWLNGWVNTEGSGSLVDDSGVIPTLEELLEQVEKIEDAVARAETVANMTVESETLPAGSEATASYANGVLSLGLPTGIQGPKGPAGKSAYDFAKDDGYTGSEAEFAAKLAVPFITPEMYGAKGDGVTDDSEAIQTAINAAAGTATVYLSNKTYVIGTGVVIDTSYAQFVCDGTLKYTGTGAAVTIKSKNAAQLRRTKISINILLADNGTGLKIDGSEGCVDATNVTINSIRHSTIGVHLYSGGDNAKPIYYCKLHINEVVSGSIGILAENAGTSYINENWYWLGQVSGGCSYGVKIIGSGSNKFLSGGFEGMASTGTAIYIENASDNIFRDIRCAENYGKKSVVFVGDCQYNDIELSRFNLAEVDISGLADIGGNYNILRSPAIGSGGRRAGCVAYVNQRYGCTYDPNFANNTYVQLAADTFADQVIGKYNNQILTSLRCDTSDLDGQTFTIGNIYSGYGSMARGYPLSFHFGSSNGKIKLQDELGNVVLDNSTGRYAGETVSVQWCGFNYYSGKNTWLIQEQGQVNATEKYVKDYVSAAMTKETWTFVLEDGSTVTKDVLLG